jgi:hypothetical protein
MPGFLQRTQLQLTAAEARLLKLCDPGRRASIVRSARDSGIPPVQRCEVVPGLTQRATRCAANVEALRARRERPLDSRRSSNALQLDASRD